MEKHIFFPIKKMVRHTHPVWDEQSQCFQSNWFPVRLSPQSEVFKLYFSPIGTVTANGLSFSSIVAPVSIYNCRSVGSSSSQKFCGPIFTVRASPVRLIDPLMSFKLDKFNYKKLYDLILFSLTNTQGLLSLQTRVRFNIWLFMFLVLVSDAALHWQYPQSQIGTDVGSPWVAVFSGMSLARDSLIIMYTVNFGF